MPESSDQTQEPRTREIVAGDSMIVSMQEVIHSLGAIAGDVVRLIAVDARLCGRTVLAMIGLTVIAALLLVGGWLFIGVAAVLLLNQLEMFSPVGATMTVGAAHIAFAALAVWRVRFIASDLTFRQSRATLRSLIPGNMTTGPCSDAKD